MARSKSVSGGKANRTSKSLNVNSPNANEDKNSPDRPANIPDVKAVAAETSSAEVAPEVKITPEPRKLEVVKTEPRKNVVNLVPINLEDEIRRRAYELYLQRGPASGSEAQDWLTAEREVRQRYQQRSA